MRLRSSGGDCVMPGGSAMRKFRVAYRASALLPWQTQPFATRAEASAFQRAKRRALWAAKVEWWSETEGRWIG